MSKFNTKQEKKIARLLLHFSSRTNSEILGRFDRTTRNRIREVMRDLHGSGDDRSDESLQDFADFLYFEPKSRCPESVVPADRRPPSDAQLISFIEVVRLPDEVLDKLLQAAPVELTLQVLCCSPESFVNRVVGRLSREDAVLVRQRLNETNSIDYSEMQSIHHEYCLVAQNLIQQGQVDVRQGS